ncbi:CLUMA_CG015722, isoform A [Clunio marinus]|uniref:CLUMA_CG015722, isoform A n=1 Tax=Clunio marinus TaxID=568069 RepID=A0A1J1IPA0_9DIPT|nr:CLUMA_CG015722, isoform A [Clunio marinus]
MMVTAAKAKTMIIGSEIKRKANQFVKIRVTQLVVLTTIKAVVGKSQSVEIKRNHARMMIVPKGQQKDEEKVVKAQKKKRKNQSVAQRGTKLKKSPQVKDRQKRNQERNVQPQARHPTRQIK